MSAALMFGWELWASVDLVFGGLPEPKIAGGKELDYFCMQTFGCPDLNKQKWEDYGGAHGDMLRVSGRDERWVMEELLPNLERRGPPFLKLCLHSRDFQLGKDIVENITDSLYRSRRTLCLVSRHYLRSNWCSLEMRLGTYRLQVEHRDVLILVFLEKIPSNLLSAHHRLARLVKTRTYIEWPQDPAQQGAFWERLWKKLLPDRGQ
ncbi:toll-like receptor 13 [Sardina pilchardus]|uniref:toll-like receptor 13 n=1 Tax=Sardina pilchardus TaxID=27697 RepID=UPI002E162422